MPKWKNSVACKGQKNLKMGLRMTSTCVVNKVERGSVVDCSLQYGDLLLKIDGHRVDKRKQALDVLKKYSQGDFKITFTVARLKTQIPLQLSRLPRDCEAIEGFNYHTAVMYSLKGCKLGLGIKSYNTKVFVSRVTECTLSSMCLSVGDAIIDIDSLPVTSVDQAKTLVFDRLRSKGFVTMAIEQANDPSNAQYVMLALKAEKTQGPDEPVPQDVIDIAKDEVRRFQTNELKVGQSILKERRGASKKKNVTFGASSVICPIACETNPKLLVHVYPQHLQNPLLITQGVLVQQPTKAPTSPLPSTSGQHDFPGAEMVEGTTEAKFSRERTTDDKTDNNERSVETEDVEAPKQGQKTKTKYGK
ncbi:hypothetical protein QR680_018540 [Steinernema hermaphroditum]|uniref:PDZ domain-containing protein n=1 Tax=Steinernema hermaphroditum TaxID=289476 RepID=A0AA39HJ75_9BILA|nr:hypothetical protein QR680_018540 [Steinernema hermaphroditum]